jgi:hypothetical protein
MDVPFAGLRDPESGIRLLLMSFSVFSRRGTASRESPVSVTLTQVIGLKCKKNTPARQLEL